MRRISALILLAIGPAVASAQGALPPAQGALPAISRVADSMTVTPGAEYRAGAFHTFLLGSNYRSLWATPIRVPVLDLATTDGGLKAKKRGGGMQTMSLHLTAKDGDEYVFRTVDKNPHVPGNGKLQGPLVTWIFRDQISALHPMAALVVSPLLDAAGVLHAPPALYVMPNDSLLGEFAPTFAGRLGWLEQWTGKPKHGEGFHGAVEIVDSDSLLKLLNTDGRQHVDGRALLTARLMDMLVNDIDRHPGQWKWARMEKGHKSPWVPIPRDRDEALIAYHGALIRPGHLVAPNVVVLDGNIDIAGLTYNSLAMDRRLLGGLEKSVFDSVARELQLRVTDSVIDAAVKEMPPEFQGSAPQLAHTLRLRRDHLSAAADGFYRLMAGYVDIHATDGADKLTVTQLDDRSIEVRLASASEEPYYLRRFDARETHEVRIYLHGGDDSVAIVGRVDRVLPVRIIGANGTKWLNDSSSARRGRNPSRIYGSETADGASYGPDTLFDRRPWVRDRGEFVPPVKDYGAGFEPETGISDHRVLGLIPHFGLTRYGYGFGRQPYVSAVNLDAAVALGLPGYRLSATADRRWENTPLHVMASARTSQFEMVDYHGLGNDSPDSTSPYFAVRQRQYQLTGALAWTLAQGSDLSLGPVMQYVTTDSTPDRFVSASHPYGFGHFGETGLQIGFHNDLMDRPHDPRWRFKLDLVGTAFPATWDVKSPYQSLTFASGGSITIPVPTAPVLVLRAGAKKLYGAFPFFDAAYLGGDHTLRRMDPERYTGDASMYGNSELRIPLTSFAVIVPLKAGLIGTTEAGRVYVGGSSPGGWHSASGGGVWIGRADQSFLVSCTYSNEPLQKGIHCQTGLSY